MKWLRETHLEAWRGWRRFMIVWIAVTIPFAIFRITTGAAQMIPVEDLLLAMPIVLVATYVGAVVYAGLRGARAGYYTCWAVAGGAAGVAFLAGFGLWALFADEAGIPGWVWLAALPVGGFTGVAYGWSADWVDL